MNVELRLEHELKTLRRSYRVLQEEHEGQSALVQEYTNKIASLEKDKAMFIELIDRYKADASGSPAGETTLTSNAKRSVPPQLSGTSKRSKLARAPIDRFDASPAGATTLTPNAKRPVPPLQSGTSKSSKSAHAPIDGSNTPQIIDKPKNFFPINTNRQFECLISSRSDDNPQYMPSTQLHTAVSEAVISQMKVWERKNCSRKAWDWRKLSISGACVYTAVVTKKSGHSQRWTEFDRACTSCTGIKRPCMKVHQKANGEEAVVLLPLPAAERGFTSKTDPGFWIKQ